MQNITLVIPPKNEKESLPIVLDELEKYNLPKIVVLEKTDTQTIEAIKNYDLKILHQEKKRIWSCFNRRHRECAN